MSALGPAAWAGSMPDDEITPDESSTSYRLVHNVPEGASAGYELGWTLVAEFTSGWRWTMALAARGAAVHAGPRVAKAVAVRVLAQQGITIDGWLDDLRADTGQTDEPTERPENGPVIFRALLRITGGPVPEASCAACPTRPRLRIGRRHGR